METLTKSKKEAIRTALRVYCGKYASQNKAANSLQGVSPATISAILNGKDTLISEDMWRSIAAQVGGLKDDWVVVETNNFREITMAIADAREWRNTLWIVGEAGCGKTTAAKTYRDENREAFYILCSEDMKRGDFVREIARMVGVKTEGYTVRQLWELILDALIQMDSPILLFDEADKLPDSVFHYFVSLYNKLEEHAGIIFLSTDYICKRVRMGLQYEKPGYKEFFSRIGRKYFILDPATVNDVTIICRANGLTTAEEIDRVINESATTAYDRAELLTTGKKRAKGVSYEYDFRRVKKSVRRTLSQRNHG